jgi:hypothetical protein
MFWISSASNVTGYRLSRIYTCLLATACSRAVGPTQTPYQNVYRGFSTVKLDSSYQSSAEVKDGGTLQSALHTRLHGAWEDDRMRKYSIFHITAL